METKYSAAMYVNALGVLKFAIPGVRSSRIRYITLTLSLFQQDLPTKSRLISVRFMFFFLPKLLILFLFFSYVLTLILYCKI